GGVLLGHKVSQGLRARGGENPARPDVVLEGDGDAVERPAIARAASRRANLGFRLPSLYQGLLGSDGQIGVELGIELLDAAEKRFDQLDRCDRLLAQHWTKQLDRSKGECVG